MLGFERVFGWGSTAPKDRYAEVLMEILSDQYPGWALAKSRMLVPDEPLDTATASGIDIGAWLVRPSIRQEILGWPASIGLAGPSSS